MGFADGGGVDNLGVHAALRRNVKKLLVCVASAEDPSLQAKGGTLGEAYDVSGLFGACTIAVPHVGRGPKWQIPMDVWNDSLQCFKDDVDENGKTPFEQMITALTDHVDKKRFETQPISCRLKLEVKENKTQGIIGGYVADVLFLFDSMRADWKNPLPKAAKEVVDGGIDGHNFSSVGSTWTFPYVSTLELEWSQKLVGLSSNLCAYNMKKVREDARYRDFFQFGRGVTRTAAAAGLGGALPATRMRRMPDDV